MLRQKREKSEKVAFSIRETAKSALGLDNEIKVWTQIGSIATQKLAKYPTTYDEDMILLQKDELN